MSDPRALLQQAEKVERSASGGFLSSLLGSRGSKLELAADLYTQAANAFRVQRQGSEAGQAFEKAAEIQFQMGEHDDVANTMVEAYKSYKNQEPVKSAKCLMKAIEHYSVRGNLRRAAQHQQNLAELLERDVGDIPGAIRAYMTAGEWYQTDQAAASACKPYLKAAELSAIKEDYVMATKSYEIVAKIYAENDALKWSLKDVFLKGGLCYLAMNDMVAAKRALESFISRDNTFSATREYQLLGDILQAVETRDSELFEEKVFSYDQLSKLDNWKTTILLRIKNTIQTEEEDLS